MAKKTISGKRTYWDAINRHLPLTASALSLIAVMRLYWLYHVVSIFFVVVCLLFLFIWLIMRQQHLSQVSFVPLFIRSYLIGASIVAYLGADAGFSESRNKFDKYIGKYPLCHEEIVLRSLGDYFLSVSKDNSRNLIDSDCKIRFSLISKESWSELYREKEDRIPGTQ